MRTSTDSMLCDPERVIAKCFSQVSMSCHSVRIFSKIYALFYVVFGHSSRLFAESSGIFLYSLYFSRHKQNLKHIFFIVGQCLLLFFSIFLVRYFKLKVVNLWKYLLRPFLNPLCCMCVVFVVRSSLFSLRCYIYCGQVCRKISVWLLLVFPCCICVEAI